MYLRICGVLSPQKLYGSEIANPQIVAFRKVRKPKKKYKSANLRICDLGTLFVVRPPLQIKVEEQRHSH
jgi:hypothetical protein